MGANDFIMLGLYGDNEKKTETTIMGCKGFRA